MPRALITGGKGFVGPYLADFLQTSGWDVVITDRPGEAAEQAGQVGMDVRDAAEVLERVRAVQPDAVYHLAAMSRPTGTERDTFYSVNLRGTLNVLDAAADIGAPVLVVGSAYAYGAYAEPVAETAPLRPVNHYGASKAAADLAAIGYALRGTRVVRARPFNHSGPGQSADFVLPRLIEQVAEIEAGRQEPVLHLGNLDSVRDFSDVRDVVRAYVLLLEHGVNGEAYNVCSGAGTTIRALVDRVLSQTAVRPNIEVSEQRVRPYDIPHLVGDPSKLNEATGWRPQHGLDDTIGDMLASARS